MLPLPYLNKWRGVEVEINRNTAVVRRRLGKSPFEHGGKRGSVKAFSGKSQWRVRKLAADAWPALVSQFGLTYHDRRPDGREAKGHLHRWLVDLKRKLPGVGYLWVMEWQARGVIHFHVWLTAAPSEGARRSLGLAWNRIAEPESGAHRAFHTHERNWISWNMGNGGYVAKYLDKARQKDVPEGWGWVGRFWGASQGLVPAGITVEVGHPTTETPAAGTGPYLIRTLERYHRAKCRKWGVVSRIFKRRTGGTVFGGGRIVSQAVEWLERVFEAEGMGRSGPWARLPG